MRKKLSASWAYTYTAGKPPWDLDYNEMPLILKRKRKALIIAYDCC